MPENSKLQNPMYTSFIQPAKYEQIVKLLTWREAMPQDCGLPESVEEELDHRLACLLDTALVEANQVGSGYIGVELDPGEKWPVKMCLLSYADDDKDRYYVSIMPSPG